MYPLLILREEIACLAILFLLFFTARDYKLGKDSVGFLRMSFFALGHIIFDIITILTVNNIDIVPAWVNKLCHVFFYLFALLFAREFFCYTFSLCHVRGKLRRARLISILPIFAYFLLLPVLPIEYINGNGTYYSAGAAPDVGFGIAIVFFLISIGLILKNHTKIEIHALHRLLPILSVLVVMELLQIIIPELLFTSGIATIILVAFFFSLENPVETLRQKVQMDALTGVQSRHSYDAALQDLERHYKNHPEANFAIVFCDINNLKHVNDTYGHHEGDKYISSISILLLKNLDNAERIYRIGGDEFVAIYYNHREELIKRDIAHLQDACKQLDAERPYDVGVATGYAMSGPDLPAIQDILDVADYMMCRDKVEQKRLRNHMEATAYDDLNVSGLTDRIFDAFAVTGDRNYLFITNLETGVTRISRSMAEYFGLPGEFMMDFDTVWASRLHPEDRTIYTDSITEVIAGKKKHHELEYRAMAPNGEYVNCTCRAGKLSGKDGEPDLFAGTIVNHSLGEKIDALTGMPNNISFSERLDSLIINHETAALMKLSLTSFSRINLLYGYSSGNEVLIKFSDALRKIVGNRGEIYRLDGTKFALILPGIAKDEVELIYSRIQFAAQHKITTAYMPMPLRVAAGVYMKPADFEGKKATLRSNIMFAYEHSKYDYYGRLEFYRESVNNGSEYALLTEIHRDAVTERAGFYMRYQPIVDSETELVVGAEALLRWRNDEYGEVGPFRFIEWLETDPCFFELGCWILRQAIADASAMLKFIPNFTINVNITIQQLQHEEFRRRVHRILEESGFPAGRLCLELTERCRALDEDFLRQEIEYFHSIGVKVAMDDVGTGSSAFALILRLPVDEMKLDRSFVSEIRSNAANQAFVQSAMEISKVKGFYICFEGIEDRETCDYLKRYPNSLYQGYYFAKPLMANELHSMVKKQGKPKKLPPPANNSAHMDR